MLILTIIDYVCCLIFYHSSVRVFQHSLKSDFVASFSFVAHNNASPLIAVPLITVITKLLACNDST